MSHGINVLMQWFWLVPNCISLGNLENKFDKNIVKVRI